MTFAAELRRAARRLLAARWPTLAAVLSLGLGLGANTAVFSAVDAVVLRPFAFADQNRLVLVETTAPSARGEVSYPDVEDWRQGSSTLSSLAAIGSLNWDMSLTGSADPVTVGARAVGGTFFSILGGTPALGRTIAPADDRPAAPRVIVLADGFWRRQFGADPAVVGRMVRLDRTPVEVVGVMPPDFRFPAQVDAWVPLVPALIDASRNGGPDLLHTRQVRFLFAVGRLAPGATPATAAAELSARLKLTDPGFGETPPRRGVVTPLADEILGRSRITLVALMAGVGLVALIACANVSAFLLARASHRAREWAVYRALGASGRQLGGQLLAESVVIAAGGAAGGWLLALWTLPVLARSLPADVPRLSAATLDARTLAFSVAVAAVAAMVCAIAAALRLRTPDLAQTLRGGGRAATSSLAGGRMLVVGEVAIAMIVLATAGLLFQSLRSLDQLDLGFAPTGLVSLTMPIPEDRYTTIEAQRAFSRRLLEGVRAVPGVESAAALLRRPLAGAVGLDTGFILEGQTSDAVARNPLLNAQVATPGALHTLGVALRHGRDFDAGDRPDSTSVVLVSENFARWAWPGQDALGKRIQIAVVRGPNPKDAVWSTVVGVTANARYRDLDGPRYDVYVPLSQSTSPAGALVVRTTARRTSVDGELRAAIRALEPDQIVTIEDLTDVVGRTEAPWRATFRLFLAFAALAVVLAVVGLSGTLMQHVASRGREIGIRLALGSTRRQMHADVLREGLRLTTVGVALGVGGAVAAGRVTQALLFDVNARDPTVLLVAGALLVSVALAACLVPARRAALVDPLVMLRDE